VSTNDTATLAFSAELIEVHSVALLRLPPEASRLLPSRGQVAVTGSLGGVAFATVVEPDGVRGHWIRVTPRLQRTARLALGDVVDVTLEVAPEWPEPEVPDDLAGALAAAPEEIREIWADITSMARWEWVRWVNATANPDTRARRVEVSISKMEHGKRRPCCFDLSSCTEPAVARSGKLIGAR